MTGYICWAISICKSGILSYLKCTRKSSHFPQFWPLMRKKNELEILKKVRIPTLCVCACLYACVCVFVCMCVRVDCSFNELLQPILINITVTEENCLKTHHIQILPVMRYKTTSFRPRLNVNLEDLNDKKKCFHTFNKKLCSIKGGSETINRNKLTEIAYGGQERVHGPAL